MGSEYQWWLVALALAAAGGIMWLLRGALPRRDVDLTDDERAAEAAWIAAQLRGAGEDVSAAAVERALELHRTYLDSPPPPPPPAESPAVPARGASGDRPAALSSTPNRDQLRSDRAEREIPPPRYGESRTGG